MAISVPVVGDPATPSPESRPPWPDVPGLEVVNGAVRPTPAVLDRAARPLPPGSGRAHAGSSAPPPDVIERGNPVSLIAIVRVPVVACLGIGMVLSVPSRYIKRRRRKAGRYMARACAAGAAGIALAAVGLTGASASSAAPRAQQTVRVADAGASVAAASPGAQLWAARYDNGGNGGATSVAASPNGKLVFVTGYVTAGALEDYATVAYSAATGAQLWAARYTDPGHGIDRAYSVAVSPNGNTVFVTGTSFTGTTYYYATIAYNAATGAQQWVTLRDHRPQRRLAGGGGQPEREDGVRHRHSTRSDYTTVAYNAATGAQLWVSTLQRPRGQWQLRPSVAVSPNGTTVFVTGASIGTRSYGLRHGRLQRRHRRPAVGRAVQRRPAAAVTRGDSVAVSPSGSTVFVTGASYTRHGSTDYATVAYNAATGAQLWAKRYNGPGSGDAQRLLGGRQPEREDGVRHRGNRRRHRRAGLRHGRLQRRHRRPAVGQRYNGPGTAATASAVAVSPTGDTVYVTGYSYGCVCGGRDYATVAYSAATGAQQWVQRYDGAGLGNEALAIAVSPTTGTVFVTGYSVDADFDYATIAYAG